MLHEWGLMFSFKFIISWVHGHPFAYFVTGRFEGDRMGVLQDLQKKPVRRWSIY